MTQISILQARRNVKMAQLIEARAAYQAIIDDCAARYTDQAWEAIGPASDLCKNILAQVDEMDAEIWDRQLRGG